MRRGGPDAMLKRHRNFFIQALFLFDLLVLAACWWAAFQLRFHYGPVLRRWVPPHIPRIGRYVQLLIAILVIWGIVFRVFRIYRARRGSPYLAEIVDLVAGDKNKISDLLEWFSRTLR